MRSMRDVVQGRDRSVRGIISKGQFVQGAQHPRTFGRGHIGRGHINPAWGKRGGLGGGWVKERKKGEWTCFLENAEWQRQASLTLSSSRRVSQWRKFTLQWSDKTGTCFSSNILSAGDKTSFSFHINIHCAYLQFAYKLKLLKPLYVLQPLPNKHFPISWQWLFHRTLHADRVQWILTNRMQFWVLKLIAILRVFSKVRGLSQWVQQCTWSPNKLWRSNFIFNLWLRYCTSSA
jgi:hypothetical protein